MRAIHAILNAAKVILGMTGNKPAAVAVGAADVALTAAEAAAPVVEDVFSKLVERVKVQAVDPAHTVFVTAPDMDAKAFRDYATALRAAFTAHRERTGAATPNVVMLPPGVTMEVVKQNAEELIHVAKFLAENERKPMQVHAPFAPQTPHIKF